MKKLIKKLICLLCITCNLSACTKTIQVDQNYQLDPTTTQVANNEGDLLNIELDPFLPSGTKLPGNKDVTWSIQEGNAYIKEGMIYKNDEAQEYEPIVLSATINNETYTYDHLLLLDPYCAYIISYFSEDGTDKEALKLCYTYNGKYWFKLNNDNAILKAKTGTKRLRDPSICRNKDGSFTLLATQGYDTNAIYAFDSNDLIHYENERLLQVNTTSPTLQMSEQQAWAPEAFYDRLLDQYVIYWSSVKDKGMFYNLTTNFNSFSYPQVLIDTGFPVIDGTIVKDGSTYTMILKDEREPMENHSQLFAATSKYNWHSYDTYSKMITGHQSEGPMVFKNLENPGWFIYYDDYTRFKFNCLYSKDLEAYDFEHVDLLDKDYLIPLEKPAHSYAIPVTWLELERIMNEYPN